MAVAAPADETVIELETAPGEVPHFVCVVTGTGADDLFPLEALGSFESDGEGGSQWFAVQPRDSWRLDGISETATSALIEEAFEPLTGAGAPQDTDCRTPGRGPCAPRLRLKLDPQLRPERYRVSCAENVRSHAGDSQARTLLMFVDFERPRGFSPIIRGVRLDGSVVHLKYGSDIKSWPFPVINVIGGDYVADRSRVMAERQAQLPLTTVCRQHTVQLPPMVGMVDETPVGVEVTLESPPGEPLMQCSTTPGAGGRFSMALPYVESPGEKTLNVSAGPSESPLARFRASWHTTRAPSVVETRVRSLSFGWREHCMFTGPSAGRACPSARLELQGVACEATGNTAGECSYHCGRDDLPLDFDLPVAVQLEGPHEERWTDSLAYVGQRIEGYVEPGARRLSVDFSAWGADNAAVARQGSVRGDRIHHVEVASPNGTLHRVVPSEQGSQLLFVPGATCGDLLTYRLVGDRYYDEALVQVRHGSLRLDHPAHSGHRVALNIGVGGGLAMASDPDPHTQPSGTLVLALSARPFGAIQEAPRASAVWFELPNLAYSVTALPHRPLTDYRLSYAGPPVSMVYSRIFASTLVLAEVLHPRFTLGGGPALAVGYPIDLEQVERYGGVQLAPAWVTELRWRVQRMASLTLTSRFFPLRKEVFLPEESGNPIRKQKRVLGNDLEAGLRFGL